MGYVEQNLMPGESIVYRTHLHWVIYTGSALVELLGVLLMICAAAYWGGLPLASLGGFLFLGGAGLAAARWVVARTSEFAVTNKRVVIKRGLVRRHTLELLLARVESIEVDQGIAGRLFGYGRIVVIGTGGTRESFDHIARPLEFRKQVQAQALA